MVGVVDALLLMAAALVLIPRHVLALDSGAYVLLALYLANWLFVLALVGLGLTAVWLVIKATIVVVCALPNRVSATRGRLLALCADAARVYPSRRAVKRAGVARFHG